jgi:hypothetical protein
VLPFRLLVNPFPEVLLENGLGDAIEVAGVGNECDWPIGPDGLERLNVKLSHRVTVAHDDFDGHMNGFDLGFSDRESTEAARAG